MFLFKFFTNNKMQQNIIETLEKDEIVQIKKNMNWFYSEINLQKYIFIWQYVTCYTQMATKYKYLGHFITEDCSDDADIIRQRRTPVIICSRKYYSL